MDFCGWDSIEPRTCAWIHYLRRRHGSVASNAHYLLSTLRAPLHCAAIEDILAVESGDMRLSLPRVAARQGPGGEHRFSVPDWLGHE